jgi:crotonobetainyl-CoA:carnitine CoA-transferase CaiB-like acyl-CoA transferase
MPRITASSTLSRFRVLDLARVRAGSTCVRFLADFGADVIRIEPPRGVDANDNMFATERLGSDFQNLNRNKRSITLNLKTEEGLAIFKRLVETTDVVVENWRPRVKERLGLSYEALACINPRVILASLSAFGQHGPYVDRPGFDQVVQGMSGLMSVTGYPEHGPVRVGFAPADTGAGTNLAIGILLALLERESSGRGQWVNTSLLQSLLVMLDFQPARFLNEGVVPVQEGNDHPLTSPMGLFRAADGLFNIGVSGDGIWARFCNVMGRLDWMDDERYRTNESRIRHRSALSAELERLFATKPRAHWVELLNQAGIPAGPMYNMAEVFEDPQVKHMQPTQTIEVDSQRKSTMLKQPIRLERTPSTIAAPAPIGGEHTEVVLAEIGIDAAEVARLRAAGIV